MNPSDYFLWDCLIDNVYCTNAHTVQEFQVEIKAAARDNR
jgi:hypothetical protein